MADLMDLDAIFSAFPDPMVSQVVPFDNETRCGLIVEWAAKGVGFGNIEFAIVKETGEVLLDTDSMGMKFVAEALMALSTRSAADYWKAEHLAGNQEIDRLKAENEKLRNAMARQAAAVRTLDLKERTEYLATQSLDSERAMNATLTEELAQCHREIERLTQEPFRLTQELASAREWKAKYAALLELTAAGGQPKSDWQSK